MRKFLLLFVLLSACGNSDNYIDPILEPYVREFEEYMGISVDYDVIIENDTEIRTNTNGHCTKFPQRQIEIRELLVENAIVEDNFDKWVVPVIYHELGHCSLRLKHDNALRDDGFPVSWMYEDGRIIQDWPIEYINYYKQEIKQKWENK